MNKKMTCLLLGLGLLVGMRVLARSSPTSESKQLSWAGRQRSYRLHLPPQLNQPAPLVVVLHGGGGQGAQIERHSGFSAVADEKGFIVIYPDGIDRGWNDGRAGEFTTAHLENIDDVGFIRAAVEETARNYPVDRHKIYATGISNGGFMSFRLGAEAADLFSAIASVAAGLPKAWADQLAPTHPVSVLLLQGTQDPLVPYAAGFVQVGRKKRGEKIGTEEAVQKWCQIDGCSPIEESQSLPDNDPNDGCTATRIRHSGGREGSEVVLLRIEGGGHTWPGRGQYLPKAIVGPVCKDFDATLEIWDFFASHSRP